MEKTQFRHVKTGKVIWATAQWIKLTQEMREMHLWEKMDATQEVAKLKFEVPGVMAATEPAHEVIDVEMPTMDATPVENIEFQDVVEEKPKKAKNK